MILMAPIKTPTSFAAIVSSMVWLVLSALSDDRLISSFVVFTVFNPVEAENLAVIFAFCAGVHGKFDHLLRDSTIRFGYLYCFLSILGDLDTARLKIECRKGVGFRYRRRLVVRDIFQFDVIQRGDSGEEPQPQANAPRPRRTAKPSPLEVLEPVTDLFDEPDEVLLLFELPGGNRKDVRCLLDGDLLLLEGAAGVRRYRRETRL